MKFAKLLKTLVIFCTPLLWLSCSSWEEVVAPDEFKPLKILFVSSDSAYVGQNIIITGENFIDNKEYNQVWFGGNVRGTVDSATSTQLFLKVPKGIQTGLISVSNGIYSDTLQTQFKIVLRKPSFKTASLNFDGLKIVNGSEPVRNEKFTDASFSLLTADQIDKYSNYTFQCGLFIPEEYSDSTMFHDNLNSILFISLSIDSTKKIIPNFIFSYYSSVVDLNSQGYGYRKCLRTE